MKLGVRGKLFLASLLFIVVFGGLGTYLLERAIRALMVKQVQGGLDATAQTAAVSAGRLLGAREQWEQTAPALAHELSLSAGAEVRIFDADGKLLSGGQSTDPTMLNASATFETAAGAQGMVRLSTPYSAVDGSLGQLRFLFVLAALFGLLVSVVMVGLASRLMTRQLRQLVKHARQIVKRRGDGPRRIALSSGDEQLGRLAGSFNYLAAEVEDAFERLGSERDRLGTILEGMSDAVLALDDRDEVTLANPAALRLLGLDESPKGSSLLETIRAPALAAIVRKAHDEGIVEDEFALPVAPHPVVLARAARLKTSGGTVIVMHDVTEIRSLETMRRDFVANVSHELRTPLAVIRANAETLLDGALTDPEHGPGFVEAIHRNSARLGQLIADLLDLSRIEAGRYVIETTTIAVCNAVRTALDAVSTMKTGQHKAFQIEVGDALAVHADGGALGQILVNLLDNAVKYTPAEGRITVRASATDDMVRIEIEDDGPGIDPHHRERIFERFYRADPGRSREMGGTGLGLSICKHLSDAMGGRVGVLPARPHGSIFWLELPRADLAHSAESTNTA